MTNKTIGISKRWHLVTPPITFDGNHNIRNGKEQLTKHMNGWHGDGQM